MAYRIEQQPQMNQRTRLLGRHRELADQIDGIDAKLEVIEVKIKYLAQLRERLLAAVGARVELKLY